MDSTHPIPNDPLKKWLDQHNQDDPVIERRMRREVLQVLQKAPASQLFEFAFLLLKHHVDHALLEIHEELERIDRFGPVCDWCGEHLAGCGCLEMEPAMMTNERIRRLSALQGQIKSCGEPSLAQRQAWDAHQRKIGEEHAERKRRLEDQFSPNACDKCGAKYSNYTPLMKRHHNYRCDGQQLGQVLVGPDTKEGRDRVDAELGKPSLQKPLSDERIAEILKPDEIIKGLANPFLSRTSRRIADSLHPASNKVNCERCGWEGVEAQLKGDAFNCPECGSTWEVSEGTIGDPDLVQAGDDYVKKQFPSSAEIERRDLEEEQSWLDRKNPEHDGKGLA